MLSNQRSKFSLPTSGIYLNGSYMSPLLKSVEKAGIKGMVRKRNPFSITPTDFFTETEKLREEYAQLINVKQNNRVVVIPSVSYGIATVAKNLKLRAGENVIVAAEQFPSNYYSWKELVHESRSDLKIVSSVQGEGRGRIWNERILECIDSKTRLVALGHVHWADGTLFQLEEIRKRTKEVDALLVIDGTQSVGALPFDVQKIQPDALVCGGYKWLMGPYSIGLAYYGEYFDGGKPLEENWINRKNSENFAALVSYQDDYQPVSLRYEVGEHSNFIAVPMMRAAIRQINQWKPANIQAYCEKISRKALLQLQEAGFWIEDANYRAHHLFGIRLPKKVSREKIVEALRKNKIAVSFRGDAIRVSPHVYNSEAEMNKLASVLTKASLPAS